MEIENAKDISLLKLSKLGSHRLCQHYKTLDLSNNTNYFTKHYKVTDKPIAFQEMFINQRLKPTAHPHIVKFLGANEESNGNLNLNFEFSKYGSLFDNYNKIYKTFLNDYDKINFIRKVLISVIDALIVIHREGIIHNDVKMENILLFKEESDNNYKVKIGDFNNSILYDARKQKIKNFFPVRLISSIPFYLEKPSFQLDYWCLGLTIYKMLFNKSPFEFDNYSDFLDSVRTRSYRDTVEFNSCAQLVLKDLVDKLLCYNRENRLNDKNVLTHPFFITKRSRVILTTFMTRKRNKRKTVLHKKFFVVNSKNFEENNFHRSRLLVGKKIKKSAENKFSKCITNYQWKSLSQRR